MNKEQIIKCSWNKMVRLRPIPKRFDGGRDGRELPPLDRDWQIQQATKEGGVPIHLSETGHGFTLNWDNIREFSSDPARGEHYGFFLLKIQICLGGRDIWVEPFVETRT